MKHIVLILSVCLLLGSQIACCTIMLPSIPDIRINVPVKVGEMQSRQETVPLSETELATVEVLFGSGSLKVKAGDSDDLFSGRFRYNIEEWEPQVTYKDGVLVVEQGGSPISPPGDVRNTWELEFSPEIPLEMDLKAVGALGDMDFTGLQLTRLDLDLGAGDFDVRFDKPNGVEMSNLTLDAGASQLNVTGIGNAGPKRMTVQGGAGEITLDFTGAWPQSADVRITAGVGAITLYLPDDVGVRVEPEGKLTNVNVDGLRRRGSAYVNDAFGEAETELRIKVTTGFGTLHLAEVRNH